MQEFINWLLTLGSNYPDLVSISVGAICSWSVATLCELYFIPIEWPAHAQKGVVILITIAAAWLSSALMWWAIDPADALYMRVVVTGVLSPISPFGYVWVGRILTKYFPAIGSVWSLEQK